MIKGPISTSFVPILLTVLGLGSVLTFFLMPVLASATSTTSKSSPLCSETSLSTINLPYYSIDMVKTGRVPGTGGSRGKGETLFTGSPFGISVSQDGRYIYEITVSFDRLKFRDSGFYTVWLTTSELDQIKRLGTLDSEGSITGQVEWNKYLVVLTLEPTDDPTITKWSGPIVSRGMSRSGMMHTLAGHGPYETEPCAKYGFGDNPRRVKD